MVKSDNFLPIAKHGVHIVGKVKVKQKGRNFRGNATVLKGNLWRPSHLPVRSRKVTFLDIILRDTGIGVQDLHVVMACKLVRREVVQGVLAEAKG